MLIWKPKTRKTPCGELQKNCCLGNSYQLWRLWRGVVCFSFSEFSSRPLIQSLYMWVNLHTHTPTHQWQKPLRDPSRILGVRALQGYFKVWWSTENVVKQQSTNLFESLGHILEMTVSSTPAGTWLFHTVFSQTEEKRIPTSEMKIAQILQPISATAQSKQLLLLYS